MTAPVIMQLNGALLKLRCVSVDPFTSAVMVQQAKKELPA